jgi:ParB/RepB/Spo0J family partition protein
MTSGQFHSVPIDQITVFPRHRRDMGDIGKLADSIRRLGLLSPIVITRDNVLRAGERRFRACKEILGYDRIECHYIDELDEFKLKQIELEENIKRKDMEWGEERTWLVEFHEHCCAHDPEWNQTKTADEIGMSQQWVSERLIVHEESKRNPELLNEPNLATAYRKVTVIRERRAKLNDQILYDFINGHEPKKPEDIINVDFVDWAKHYEGAKFNFLHCDFPYGINTDKRNQGNAAIAVHGGYDDSPETYWRLLEGALRQPRPDMRRVRAYYVLVLHVQLR